MSNTGLGAQKASSLAKVGFLQCRGGGGGKGETSENWGQGGDEASN